MLEIYGKPLTEDMDKILASSLGRVAKDIRCTKRKEFCDSIDRGLDLCRLLEENGFYLIEKKL